MCDELQMCTKYCKLINRKLVLDPAVFHAAPSISNIPLLLAPAESSTGLSRVANVDRSREGLSEGLTGSQELLAPLVVMVCVNVTDGELIQSPSKAPPLSKHKSRALSQMNM